MKKDNHIQYIELYSTDLAVTKEFYSKTSGWVFTDYGDNYVAFSERESGVDGGFAKVAEIKKGGPLVVLFHTKLEEAKENVVTSGGSISKNIFSFPGGRRFHFIDPVGNELAVWAE